MARYVLNRRSGVLHELPASESCKTDAIKDDLRFDSDDDEEVVFVDGNIVAFCLRCFPAEVE